MCELVSLTFFRNFVHQMIGFINLFSVFLLILRKFWPKSFKTLMLSQELKKKVKTPGVPGCFRGHERRQKRSAKWAGMYNGSPEGFQFVNRVS